MPRKRTRLLTISRRRAGKVYEVEKILAETTIRGRRHYLVSWVGYPDEEDNTWEVAENLHSCPDVLAEYKKRAADNATKLAVTQPQAAQPQRAAKKPAKVAMNVKKITQMDRKHPRYKFRVTATTNTAKDKKLAVANLPKKTKRAATVNSTARITSSKKQAPKKGLTSPPRQKMKLMARRLPTPRRGGYKKTEPDDVEPWTTPSNTNVARGHELDLSLPTSTPSRISVLRSSLRTSAQIPRKLNLSLSGARIGEKTSAGNSLAVVPYRAPLSQPPSEDEHAFLKCELCFVDIVDRPNELNAHVRKHVVETFGCPIDGCHIRTQLRADMAEHIMLTHGHRALAVDLTQNCPRLSAILQERTRSCFPQSRHLLPGIQCQICRKAVSPAYFALHEHAMTHMALSTPPLACSLCSFRTFSHDQIHRHFAVVRCGGHVLPAVDHSEVEQMFRRAYPVLHGYDYTVDSEIRMAANPDRAADAEPDTLRAAPYEIEETVAEENNEVSVVVHEEVVPFDLMK